MARSSWRASNARAIAFYRCGFEQVGSQPFLLGRDLQTDFVMRRTNL